MYTTYAVGFALRWRVISEVYYNNIIYLVYKKKKFLSVPHIKPPRAHFDAVGGPTTLPQQPATAYPLALLSYIRGYFTVVTKGCIFGFD